MATLYELLASGATRPRWIVELVDGNIAFTSGPILQPTRDYFTIIDEDKVSIDAVEIDPLEGRTSIGGARAVLTDIDGIASDIAALALGLPGAEALLKLGCAEIPEADYETQFRGTLTELACSETHGAYALRFKDALGQTMRQVFLSASNTAPVTLTGNPLDLFLKILTSTGDGTNGAYDTLALTNGLGVSASKWVDIAAIESERDSWLAGVTVSFTIRESTAGHDFLTQQLLRPFGAHTFVNSEGKIAVRFVRPYALPATAYALDHSNLRSPPPAPRLQLDGQTINQVVVKFDYDSSSKQYDSVLTFNDRARQALFGQIVTHTLESYGLRTSLGGAALASAIAARLFKTFGTFRPRMPLSCQLSALAMQIGDVALLTCRTLPTVMSGARYVRASNLTGKSGKFGGSPAYLSIKPRYAVNHAAWMPDYSEQTTTQKLRGWSVCSGATGLMGDGTPGYIVAPDQVIPVEVVTDADAVGVESMQIQVFRRAPNVATVSCDFDGVMLNVDPTKRYAYTAPAGMPDYSLQTSVQRARYWSICSGATGQMGDGSQAYGVVG